MSQYISPKSWGPHFWYMLRCISHNYPISPTQEDVNHVKIFLNEFQYILPCDICKYSLKQHYIKHPIENALANKEKLIEWVEIIYNETKKVINDKRIKIMDPIEEPEEEIKPVRITYKPKEDNYEMMKFPNSYSIINNIPKNPYETNENLMPEIIPINILSQKNNQQPDINFFKFDNEPSFINQKIQNIKLPDKKDNRFDKINKSDRIKKNISIPPIIPPDLSSFDTKNIKNYKIKEKKIEPSSKLLIVKKCR